MSNLVLLGLTFLTLSLTGINGKQTPKVQNLTDPEPVLWSEDFSTLNSEMSPYFEAESGIGYPISGSGNECVYTHTLSPEQKTESNNYSLSFDIKLLPTQNQTSFFLHMLGATKEGTSIYMSLESNGTWVCLCAVDGGCITSGNGNATNYKDGSMHNESVNLFNDFVHVEYLHYNTLFEVYINGTRFLSQALMNFGNNNWNTRVNYTEGSITGFIFHWRDLNAGARTYAIDNIKLKEILPPANVSYEETTSIENSRSKFFNDGINGSKLAYSSYSVEAKFEKKTNILGLQTISLELAGLNGGLGNQNNGDNYSLDFCVDIKASSYTPYISYKNEGVQKLEFTTINEKLSSITIRVIVYGTTLDLIINNKKISTVNFRNDLSTYKGVLQGVAVKNCAALVWTHLKYEKLPDVVEKVIVTSSSNKAYIGDMITFALNTQPANAGYNELAWIVNNNKIENTSLTIEIQMTQVGTTRVYAIVDGVRSMTCNVNVVALPEKESSEGCKGEISATLSITLVSLLGLIFVSKKKDGVR